MSKDLLAKKDYQNLRDDVDQEVFIEHAFKCTQVLGKVAKNLDPGSNRELLCGKFTTKDLNHQILRDTQVEIKESRESS